MFVFLVLLFFFIFICSHVLSFVVEFSNSLLHFWLLTCFALTGYCKTYKYPLVKVLKLDSVNFVFGSWLNPRNTNWKLCNHDLILCCSYFHQHVSLEYIPTNSIAIILVDLNPCDAHVAMWED